MNKMKMYYWLTKPGIVYSNTIAAMAGFFLASSHIGRFDLLVFLAVVVGIAFVISSACVFNNYIDRNIDSKMKRTKWRATVTGKISPKAVIIFGGVLGVVGFGLLVFLTNWVSVGMAALATVAYVALYSIAKRKTVHGTLVGTISGALPSVIGYTAVMNRVDAIAIILFVIMVCWQMPHFYAIAMRRRNDYAAAKIPVLPIVRGMGLTKVQVLFYIVAFIVANVLLVVSGATGYVYLLVIGCLGVIWLIKGIRGFRVDNDEAWARRMFSFSLIVLLTWSFMIAVGGLLP